MTHLPAHIRDAFHEWLEDGQPERAAVELNYARTDWSARELLMVLSGCSDTLPNLYSEELDLPPGARYSEVAQGLLQARGESWIWEPNGARPVPAQTGR